MTSWEEEKLIIRLARSGDFIELNRKLSNLPKSCEIKSIMDHERNNLLHLAVQSKSMATIQTVLKYAQFDIFDTNKYSDTALNYAVKMNCPLEIIEFLVEYCPTFLLIVNNEKDWPLRTAMGLYKMDVAELLRDKERKHKVENVRNKISIERDSKFYIFLKEAEIHEIIFPDHALDSIFSHLFGSVSVNSISFIENALCLLTAYEANPINEAHRDWFLNKFYLQDSNEYKDLILEVFESKPCFNSTEQMNAVVFFLHSNFKQISSKIVKILNNSRYEYHIAFYRCYYYLFTLYMSNKNLFKKIAPIVNDIWCERDNLHYRMNTIKFFYHYSPEISAMYPEISFCDYHEFLDDIGARDFNILHFFNNEDVIYNLGFFIAIFMPFLPIPSANDIISLRFSVTSGSICRFELRKFRDSVFSQLSDQSDQEEPMSLKQIGRIQVRRNIFEANKDRSEAEILSKIISLELPKSIMNFLLFNYSAYEMCK